MKVVFREPKEIASRCQMINEIAFLTYLAKHYPSISVPRIYAYSLDEEGINSPYIALEYIEGQPLDTSWATLSLTEKEAIVDQIAAILVQLGEINVGAIGGLTLDHQPGPTVEGVKLFRGRVSIPTSVMLNGYRSNEYARINSTLRNVMMLVPISLLQHTL